MRNYKTLSLLLLAALSLGVLSGCSDVKNREKVSEDNSFKGVSVSIKVNSRSTTTGTQSTPTLEKELESKISKTLSQVLISGEGKEKLFTDNSVSSIAESFPNYKKADKNAAEVSYDFFNTENESDKIVVATINQLVQTKGSPDISNAGKIYFDTSGTIIGFDVVATPVSKAEAS